jgi:hypothetical protein
MTDATRYLFQYLYASDPKDGLDSNVWTMDNDYEIVSLGSRGQTFQWAQMPSQSQQRTNKSRDHEIVQAGQHVQDPKSRFSHHMILQRTHSVLFVICNNASYTRV